MFGSNRNFSRLVWRYRGFCTTSQRRTINKVLGDVDEAITKSKLKTGDTVLAGGFGLCGIPRTLIKGIKARPDITHLTVASNNAGIDGAGLGVLLESRQISKLMVSYIGENKNLEKLYLSGELDIELTPQGTLAERCRAAGAGVPAFYTPSAVGTVVETGELPIRFGKDGKSVVKYSEPKETKIIDGKKYLLEKALHGDVALVKATKADALGNCVFEATINNFNSVMGRAARSTIVEADEIVPVGSIPPHQVHLPGIYVTGVIKSTAEKQFERVTLAKTPEEIESQVHNAGPRERIIKRAAQEFKDGMYANLGIGIPTLAPAFVDKNVSVQLQSENGVLGVGPYPQKGEESPDYINAGKETITLKEGAAVFGSEESFGMIRSGRINMSMLGAMQVSQHGDIANWMLPGRVKGMGGAMDLVANPDNTKIVVTMEHTDKKGNSKIVDTCEFPLTGQKCVSRIITDLAVFDVDHDSGLTLIETAPGVSVDEIKSKTGAQFKVSDDIKSMQI
ncbi:hypothetical protein TRICI_001959 [Trichomonascus ciferrii]|uniref:Succinyl-CoA:3-ketoacid-coenzyme A transferase n=1 Tax=Trichomonascus ciferrii TaxID=44093 RepID=A0A642VC58_9ASCO|nr:hypothetical protein TRICI_001959 [Trichomonascus ciferrii]